MVDLPASCVLALCSVSLVSDWLSTLLSISLALHVSESLNKVSLLLVDALAACTRDEPFLIFVLSFTVFCPLVLLSSGSLKTHFFPVGGKCLFPHFEHKYFVFPISLKKGLSIWQIYKGTGPLAHCLFDNLGLNSSYQLQGITWVRPSLSTGLQAAQA